MEDAPAFSTLRVEVDGPIGRITLTQGDKLNPLGTTALREIALAAQWFDTTDAHVVIVTAKAAGSQRGSISESSPVVTGRTRTLRRVATRPTSVD